jgi:hypothetical protein
MKQIITQAIALLPLLWLHGIESLIALAAFLLVSLHASASNVAAKARSTEQRVANLEGKVFPNTGGTVSGDVNATGTVSANTLQGTLNAGYVSGTVSNANVANNLNGLSIPQSRGGGMTNAPSSYNQSWGDSVVNEVTQINNSLGAAGIFV